MKKAQKTIVIDGENTPYTLQSKGVRMSIFGKNAFVVTAPIWLPNYFIEKIIREKKEWVLKIFPLFSLSRSNIGKEKILYKKHKEKARELILRRLKYFNGAYGLSWNKVSIRNQKTRWGSCSKKKNLNFHYKLALVPEPLADYVVVHELCHLMEFNHSKKFWELVAKSIPDHHLRKKELLNYRL